MKIIVERTKAVDSNVMIDFSTEYGSAIAVWEGEMPSVSCEYHVELDIEDTLVWNKDITKNEAEEHSIRMYQDKVSLSGVLDSVDDDGYSILRIGSSIIPFISSGNSFEIGTSITVFSENLSLSLVDY